MNRPHRVENPDYKPVSARYCGLQVYLNDTHSFCVTDADGCVLCSECLVYVDSFNRGYTCDYCGAYVCERHGANLCWPNAMCVNCSDEG